MIRRPLTEITLKLEDLQEYEDFRKDQASSANNSSLSSELQEDTPKHLIGFSKRIDDIHKRIGYAPKKKASASSTGQ